MKAIIEFLKAGFLYQEANFTLILLLLANINP